MNDNLSYSIQELEEMMSDGVSVCSGPCECIVEPDGTCPQGFSSVLIKLGMI